MAVVRVTWTDRLVASDPGSVRLALALRAVGSLAVALLAADLVTRGLGLAGLAATVVLILSSVLTMMSTFTASDPTVRGRIITQVCLPGALLVGLVVAMLVDRHRVLSLSLFVVVMFVAVWIRRFGPRFFALGMVAWMGYFFALFLQLSLAMVPLVLLAAGTATLVTVGITALVAPPRPARRLRRLVHSLHARIRIARAAGPDGDTGRALLRANEVAVLVDGQLAVPGAVPDADRAREVRGAVLRLELALTAVLADPDPADPDPGDPRAGTAAAELDDATRRLDAVVADRTPSPSGAADPAPFVPAAELFAGFLPGSAVTVMDMPGRGPRQLVLATRQALQIVVAGGLTIVVGDLVSGQRWYWAVLACFLAFTGTATAAETVRKAGQRTGGTVVGVAVALLLTPLVGHAVPVVLTVVLVALFVGFYLFRVSYTSLAFAVTIIVAELYQLLGTFSGALLALRIGETAIGAVIGGVVAVAFLPVTARRAEATAHLRLAEALRDALDGASALLAAAPDERPDAVADLHGRSRALDAAIHQLAVIGLPFAARRSVARDAARRRLTAWTTCAVRVRAGVLAVADRADRADRTGGPLTADTDRVRAALDDVRDLAGALAAGETPGATAGGSASDPADDVLAELAALHGAVVALHEIGGTAPRRVAVPGGRSPAPGADPRPGGAPAGLVRGRVTDGAGTPLDATVTLVDAAGRQRGRATAAGDGYRLDVPAAGAYQLVAIAPGHAPEAARLVLGPGVGSRPEARAVDQDLVLAVSRPAVSHRATPTGPDRAGRLRPADPVA